ncbi:MAG: nucleotidyl transferase AbiEii/AbiGii toxin family protein, partial [Clostridiales bacterium]|nr:nucleotidyl transferase AbiEii/AbiGii toxin family protein [Clostridiales bacterium]
YKGIEFQIIGHIKNTRTPFNVDIGIGDVIVPKAEKRAIPVQLEDFECPQVSTYSLESTISEKFDAMLQRLELNSRMRDFFDVYFMAHTFDFDGRKLQEAIFETLQNRGTAYDRDSMRAVIALANDSDMRTRWRQAVRRMKLPDLSFEEVVNTLQVFLGPVFDAVVNENELLNKWSAKMQKWDGLDRTIL